MDSRGRSEKTIVVGHIDAQISCLPVCVSGARQPTKMELTCHGTAENKLAPTHFLHGATTRGIEVLIPPYQSPAEDDRAPPHTRFATRPVGSTASLLAGAAER